MYVFIYMNKNKKITIRITESQMRRLSDTLINEEVNQSQFLREMIDKYVRYCRKTNKQDVQHVIQEIKDANKENKKYNL
jgi:metal-responsive CopG/Arc/MetJ family transcriptional regulator